MRKDILREAAGYLAGRRSRRIWKKVVGALACVVVFCTVYALILPAITLERTPQCGKEEHTHSEACYTSAAAGSGRILICTPESLGLHRHTDTCLDESGEYRCGESDFVVHAHNAACLDESGALRCPLPEVKAHTHDESCYAPMEEKPPHTHTDECYTPERGGLVCTVPEGEDSHTHSADAGCYDESGALLCQQEESSGHQHTDDCYAWEAVLICGLPAGPAEPEGSTAPVLTCGKEEIILHKHTAEECFETDGEGNTRLICGKTQILEHVHTDACFQTVEEPADAGTLSCGLEEHTHSAACGVIGLIEELPTRQSIEERMAAFTEDGDEEGRDAYLTDLQIRVQEAYDAYAALPEDEQAKVPNADRLTALEWLLGVQLQETANVTVEVEGVDVGVTSWTPPGNSEARSYLQAALLSVGQGYTIQNIEYYQIAKFTGDTATVTYNTGGLSAAETGAQVFVYDLGEDGTAAPVQCEVSNPQTGNEAFTGFQFSATSTDTPSRIYAFISAHPATLEEMGIYLGTEQDNGVWVAYDAKDPKDANVKATVTLPEGASAQEGYRIFIRKINEGEGSYPHEDEIKKTAGEYNDWQCYTIRWMKQDETGLHMVPLNDGFSGDQAATVRIEYLKEEARLKGPAGGRKLLVFNSNKDGTLQERVADTVENVLVEGDFYKSFTFTTTHTGPYVFVSKTLEKGFIEQVAIESIVDGSDPFDATGDLLNGMIGQVDKPGNDHGENNRVVRSYDTIQYNLAVTFAARQETVTEPETKMYFELVLGKSATAARFAFDKMLWLGDHYSVEYLNSQDEVVMVMDHNGGFYEPLRDESGNVIRDESGFALANTSKPVSFNSQISGSLAGSSSYKVATGGVVKQRLSGWTVVKPKEGETSALAGTQTFTMAVEVRNADNGEIFAPTFRLWLEGNEENYGKETANEDGTLIPATPDDGNLLDISPNGSNAITVSAGTNFNVQLKKNNDMSYKNWFDFSTGKAVAEPTRTELVRLANLPENHGKSDPARFTEGGKPLSADKQAQYANYRYGRITCYGITLQLYSDTDNDPDKNRAAKGMKGISLPVGDITFDLNFWSEAKSKDPGLDESEYTAILPASLRLTTMWLRIPCLRA